MRFDSMIRKANKTLSVPTIILFSLTASVAVACSTVVLGEGEASLVAYSYDIAGTGDGFIVANPSGMHRNSIMDGDPAQWTAKYNNITFNQLGPGMPTAGMSAAGLVVTLMWNRDVVYSTSGSAAVVNELEFIQRLLDVASSVDEALELINDVRIEGIIPIHFLLTDSQGAVAVVAPTPDGYDVHTGDKLPIPALTNSSYFQLVEGLADYEGFGGDIAPADRDTPARASSLKRFVTAADAWRTTGPEPRYDQAFSVLDEVENGETRWQIVFDPNAARVSFQGVEAIEPLHFELIALDFTCQNYPMALNISSITSISTSATFMPVGVGAVTDIVRDVLDGFPAIKAIGPNIAEGLTQGLFASASCES